MNVNIKQKVIVEGVTIELDKEEAQVLSSILAQYCKDFRDKTVLCKTYGSYHLASNLELKLSL